MSSLTFLKKKCKAYLVRLRKKQEVNFYSSDDLEIPSFSIKILPSFCKWPMALLNAFLLKPNLDLISSGEDLSW